MRRLDNLIDERKCHGEVGRIRWPNGARCPGCTPNKIAGRGRNHRRRERRRHACKSCGKRFDDLAGTLFMGRHPPLSARFAHPCLMGLNASSRRVAEGLNPNESDGRAMAEALRGGIIRRRSKARMSGVAEGGEAYVAAGREGGPDRSRGRAPRRRRLRGAPGRGAPEKEKPPIFGTIGRGGEARIAMRENVRQRAARPLIGAAIEPGTAVDAGEQVICAALPRWGHARQSARHGRGECARDEDGDGFHEVPVNTLEGFWSLLRSWPRPHRGISQEKLPICLGSFEFAHDVGRRGRALLGSLLDTLLQPAACPQNPI
jgi:transposase-like protein